jgi:hypothetical protein
LEGDGVAEGFELADVAAFAAFGVDAGGLEALHVQPDLGEDHVRGGRVDAAWQM